MAALTASVDVNASTVATDALPSKTSLRSLLNGDAPITLGNGLKAAFVKVTFDGGDYAAGGVDINLLTELHEWTAILGCVPAFFTDSVLKYASYNPATDKVVVSTASDGAEHGTSALSGDVTFLVLGY